MLEIGIFLLFSKGTLWIMDKCRMSILVVTGTHDEESGREVEDDAD